ncbi:MAG: bifunctional glutamate N-acetyltransferase/amino-acid acetyltransferase ArgJ, partial [Gammaproteobacteria bacterium]|nr:bifunctional glutamate N-acetyltransferase/amino-acid acetyltransferase ArgJ [Gammaproteobacteria bacterium]
MPVNLKPAPDLAVVSGIRLASVAAGIRYPGRPDLTLIECAPGTQVAAVFTRNRFCAAPVQLAREHLAGETRVRALVINTGNANAGTGAPGLDAARRSCVAVGAELGCDAAEVLPFSTGVIGEPLPVDRLVAALPDCAARLDANGWNQAADAIRTTDTVPKGASRQLRIDGALVTLSGIAKGSGMIRPDMATMLAFVACDARISRRLLQDMLERAVAVSFHRITVDGDTSTNDACVLMATGQAAVTIGESGPQRDALQAALDELCAELAQALVRDAEGASKFISVQVSGAGSDAECARVAFTIAESPLVKTAFFA